MILRKRYRVTLDGAVVATGGLRDAKAAVGQVVGQYAGEDAHAAAWVHESLAGSHFDGMLRDGKLWSVRIGLRTLRVERAGRR